VIAFQENLVASADAHHLVADFVEARGGIAGAQEGEGGGAYQDRLRATADAPGQLRFRN